MKIYENSQAAISSLSVGVDAVSLSLSHALSLYLSIYLDASTHLVWHWIQEQIKKMNS